MTRLQVIVATFGWLALAACSSGESAAAPAAPQLVADGAPDCSAVMTLPPRPGLQATAAGPGIVRLTVFAYVELPVATTLQVSGSSLAIDVTSHGPNQAFCSIPLRVSPLAAGNWQIAVTVHHPDRRPDDKLTAKVTVAR